MSLALPEEAAPAAIKATAIAIAGLSVRFGEALAVDDVSLTVPEGASVGLVGESGSGKSTVLRAIAGLVAAEGQIAVAGEPLGPKRDRAFFRTVQMVFQDPYASLHPRHTVDRTLAEPLLLHRAQGIEARIEEALVRVGLGPEFRFRYPHQLSGGQRQRIAIARALMLEPRILLLDEPTSALDVSVQAEVLTLLERLRTEQGLTYLMVSHDLPVIAHMCEQVAVMREGRILEVLSAEAMRTGQPQHPYTRDLLAASQGYAAEPGSSR
ncbi:MAG: ABC transporter ATP-binding protein [Pseudomonadota bacterium]